MDLGQHDSGVAGVTVTVESALWKERVKEEKEYERDAAVGPITM